MSDITQWASGGTSTAPSNAYILQGFVAGESPASANFNWIIQELVNYTDTQIAGVSGGVDTTGASAGDIAYYDGASVVMDTPLNVIGNSTETAQGLIQIATQVVVDAGTDDTQAVTPLKLKTNLDTRFGANTTPMDTTGMTANQVLRMNAALTELEPVDAVDLIPDATTTVKGIIELATNAETQTGTDTVRGVTPAGLASVTSTETRAGLSEISTTAEMLTGTDDTNKLINPKKLNDLFDYAGGAYSNGEVPAWDSTLNAGAGGFSATPVASIGTTWTDVTASRNRAVTYTNSTGKTIFVSIKIASGGSFPSGYLYIDGNMMSTNSTATGTNNTTIAPIPNGSTYMFDTFPTTVGTIVSWWELI